MESGKREREIQWERRTAAKRFCFPFCFPAFRNGEKRANCDVEEETKTTENQSNCHGTIHQDRLLNVGWHAEFRPCGLDCAAK